MVNSDKKYDVFISFRGEDTRSSFTAQLHQALSNRNIESYIDYNLVKGDEVGPALAKAIQDSHISIVVFSENYATSKWCLDELLHILHCRKLNGQVVIPVFCNIDPSHVRHQKKSYEMAFARYERELGNTKSNVDKVFEWKAALTLAANISGWDSRKYKDDSQVIGNIVEDVLQKLSLMYPNELKDLVKIDENIMYIDSLLKTIPRIGIWGMNGIGKTTIAKQMFAKNFAYYDNVCFLEKVSEESEKFGSISVRNKLLSELLKREITASDVHGLHTFIQRRLNGKKSFIVLDDIDSATQLDYLCEELDDLGPKSRLIITTRDRHTLIGKVDEIYEVTTWKLKDSLKLFSFGAFKQSHPRKGYEHLSERAVEYAGGVPLALKVLGPHLYSRKPKFWESELSYYENQGGSFPEIQKSLRLSYNGLPWREKEMFLDIAFFFKGEDKYFVTRILDAFGFNATSGIDILEDKALITISNNSRIQMHGLLQKMAFDIVREEYNNDPGKRSRLKDAKDIRDVLGNNKGSDAIEGIIFDLSQKVDLHVRADTFNLMTKLRFLKFHIPSGKKKLGTVHLPENIMPFFDKLTYLEWNGYPLKSLPQPFRAEQLIQICLPHSNIEHLWYGMQELVNLEAIDLRECKQLINLPDLSGALKLKELRLSGCESLCQVQPSAFSKDTLDTLLLDRCTKLQILISEKHLTSLKYFSVNGCLSMKEFSLSSDSIISLDLSNTGIEILHPSIGGMKKLTWLSLEGLNLTNIPIELSRLRLLTHLRISKCSVVTKSILETLFDGLKILKLLHLKDCCNLFELPANVSSLSSLYELRLDGSSVKELPASIKHLSELEIQSLDNCTKLLCLPELPLSIKEFQADNCTSLKTVSTLKNFLRNMIGQKKFISFKNCIKMVMDGPSLDRIMEDAILTMKSAAFHNVLVRKYRFQTHSFNYNSAEVCLPGRRLSTQFKHRSTTSSVTIKVSNSVGFILSVVVPPSNIKQPHGYYVEITCQCYSEDGKRKVGHMSSWNHKPISNLNMDHVFVWYDPYHSDRILNSGERRISFEFCVTAYKISRTELGLICIKECGVCPIYYSESQKVLGTGILDGSLRLELNEEIQFESRLGVGYDEGEDTDNDESFFNNAIKTDKSFDDEESHPSVSSTSLYLTNKAKTYEELKNIPSDSYTNLLQIQEAPNKLNPNTPIAAESSSSESLKKSSTFDPEYSPVDYSEYKRILEEDPMAIVEKLLSGELDRSSQPSQSTTQSEATETQSESIEMLLYELRQLAFSKNLLKNLPNDVALREEVKALLVKLNFRANELSEKQSSGINDFTRIFIEATTNIDEGKLSNDTLQQLNVDHKDSIAMLQASKNKIKMFEESIIAGEDKIKDMDVEIEDIKAQIHLLEEKERKVQQEKSQLEVACSTSKEKKSEIVEETKNVSLKIIQTYEKIDRVKMKKGALDSNYEMLEEQYAIMKLSPPF